MLIVFYDMIEDMEADKKLKLIVAELFIRGRKINISVVFKIKHFEKLKNY